MIRFPAPTLVVAALSFLMPLQAGAADSGGYWGGIAEEVCAAIDQAEALARAGKPDEAKEAVITAYFALFEDKKMEIAERQSLGEQHIVGVEDQFNALRKAAGRQTDLHALAEPLRQALRVDAKALDTAKVAADGKGGQ
jgi:hypothetical protein